MVTHNYSGSSPKPVICPDFPQITSTRAKRNENVQLQPNKLWPNIQCHKSVMMISIIIMHGVEHSVSYTRLSHTGPTSCHQTSSLSCSPKEGKASPLLIPVGVTLYNIRYHRNTVYNIQNVYLKVLCDGQAYTTKS